jgi:hypothetical protein
MPPVAPSPAVRGSSPREHNHSEEASPSQSERKEEELDERAQGMVLLKLE